MESQTSGSTFMRGSNPAMAIRLAKALEPYQPMFIEEPVPPENDLRVATVARSTSIPIATGERLFTKWGFREVLEKTGSHHPSTRPIPCRRYSRCKKIGSHGGMLLCSHSAPLPTWANCSGRMPGVGRLHTRLSLAQEHMTLGEGYLKEPFQIIDGYIALPTKAGLGIELDEEALADKLYDGSWETPRLWHEDGSVADW